MHKDLSDYHMFTGPARLNKSINSLVGLIKGISIDARLTLGEISFLNNWLSEHRNLQDRHPYNELIPVIANAMADGILTAEEREDISWLAAKLCDSSYYNSATADMQRLHAIVGAIAVDGEINEIELRGLSEWLDEHDHLKTCWPYDEIRSLVTNVLADGKINEKEHRLIHGFFTEFITHFDERTITVPLLAENTTLTGLCAVCPDISFTETTFCFTGESKRFSRSALTDLVTTHGGRVIGSVSRKLNYLVIGAEGNPCWTYACYGRKVEQAVELRKKGARITIVHENDFHDAIADLG